MNKICMVLILALSIGQLYAESAADSLVKFHNLEESHKIDWVNFKTERAQKQAKIIKEEIKNWAKFLKKYSEYDAKNKDCTPQSIEKHMTDKLQDSIALYKKHTMACRNLMEKESKEARELADRHDKELMEFEKKHELSTPELVITIGEVFGE